MIIVRADTVAWRDVERESWNGLKRFNNIDTCADIISHLHSLSREHRGNARKQAEQIRFCLSLAREYYDASRAVSLATRPVLLYYSAMNLALAEILLKQSGESSLDRAREQHRHHGLTAEVLLKKPDRTSLAAAADNLIAKPTRNSDGSGFGTFELWHKSAREMPVIGSWTNRKLNQGGHRAILGVVDERMPTLPHRGISLMDCITSLPTLIDTVLDLKSRPKFVRVSVEHEQRDDKRHSLKFIVHPAPANQFNDFCELVKVAPSSIEYLDFQELASGGIITFSFDPEIDVAFEFPPACCITTDLAHFYTYKPCLNEFGFFYVALFLAGSYARYYPDKWIKDIEGATPLLGAIEALIASAETRMPLLLLSEMKRSYLVPE